VLVCGGAGYIGSHVVRMLAEARRPLVVVDDLSVGHRQALPAGVEFVQASILDRRAMDRLFRRHEFQAVVHLCASAYVGESVQNPRKYYRNNIAAGLALLEAMVDHGVRRLVFSSSCTVYGLAEQIPLDEECSIAPISPYGRTKAMFEQVLGDFDHAYGLRWASLRYFNAAGAWPDGTIGEDHEPETHLIPLVLRRALRARRPDLFPAGNGEVEVYGGDYPTPDGTCIRDYIHVCDLADAHLRALDYLLDDQPSVTVNLANEAGFSVLQIIDACREVTGEDIPHRVVPRRPGDPAELVGSNRRARRLLGWRPKHSDIRNIIASAWRWHQGHPTGYAPQATAYEPAEA